MEMIGFMATWTTYGTWLPGDERGYVDNKGQLQKGNPTLLQKSKELQKSDSVKLNAIEKNLIKQTIVEEALKNNHKIYSVAVCSNHVHLLAKPHNEPIEKLVSRYKSVTTRACWEHGRKGKIWTRGFDEQFCFTNEELGARYAYILKHKE